MPTYVCDHLHDIKRALGPVFDSVSEATKQADADLAAAGVNYVAHDAATQNQRRCRRIRECLDEILSELPVR